MKTIRLTFFLLVLQIISFAVPAQDREEVMLRHQLSLTKDSLHYIDLYNQVGFLLHMHSPDSTFNYGIRGLSLSESLHYPKGMAAAYANLAAALMLKGLYKQALDYYSKSYAAYKKAGDKAGMMQSLMNDAIAFDFIGDSAKRLLYAHRAINMTPTMQTDSVTSMMYVNYVALNPTLSADSAQFYLQKAKTIASRYHDERVFLAIDQEDASRLIAKKQLAMARIHIDRILSTASRNHWDYHYLEGLDLLASYQLALQKTDSAINIYRQIYKTAISDKFSFWQAEVLVDLIHCAKLKRDVQLQLYYHELFAIALKKKNDDMSTFIGDYLNYTVAQEKIRKLELANDGNLARIRWFIRITIGGVSLTALLIILYRRSNVLTKLLSANDAFKDKLISILAHDFRSPIGSTLGLITLLRDDDLEKDEAIPLFDTLEQDLRNVLLTFDNLLAWVRAQSAGYEYKPQEVLVRSAWEENIYFFKELIHRKDLSIVMEIPHDLQLHTDKEILQFVNRNVLHNSIKYSPAHGQITIHCELANGLLLTTLKDEGKGMTLIELEKLFSFSKESGKTESGGAGMAMTISKELLALLRGSIWAESIPGKGTSFYYTLLPG